jgi:hypothetical protein
MAGLVENRRVASARQRMVEACAGLLDLRVVASTKTFDAVVAGLVAGR